MRKNIPAILGLTGFALMAAILIWMFAQHGTDGLYYVNGEYRLYFNVAIGLGLSLLVFSLVYLALKNRLKGFGLGILASLLVLLSIPGLLIPPAALAYAGGYLSGSIGDTPPQLFIADGTGTNGVPNLAVTYNTSTPSADILSWGKTGSLSTITEPKAVNQHVFMLRGLSPATTYTYRVNQGQTHSFTTPSTDGNLHFAVGSDAHFGADDNRTDLISDMLAAIKDPANRYDMIFSLGDLVEYGFSQSQWSEAFNTFSATTSSIPIRYAIGNHESLFAGFGNYLRYSYPEGIDVQTGSRLWYRIDVGKIHFLVLDMEWSAESYTRAQADWLEAQLKAIPAGDWKCVLGHGFYYASGRVEDGWNWWDNPETINSLTPLFEQYKVDLVFSGHNHQMELLQNNGVTYAICGALGGASDETFTYHSPASLWLASGNYGFVDVSIDGDTATLTFRDPTYADLKTISINKHA